VPTVSNLNKKIDGLNTKIDVVKLMHVPFWKPPAEEKAILAADKAKGLIRTEAFALPNK
jgi:hypothetical protein